MTLRFNENLKMSHVGPDDFSQENVIKPKVSIKIQPTHTRFRYPCEGSHGNANGEGSTPTKPIYPTIQVSGYVGRVKVNVSCATENGKSHPNRITCGNKKCNHGACDFMHESPDMTIEFKKLGIQCVKRDNIDQELEDRKKRNIDPFNKGFDHYKEPQNIDMKSVRLCFQVFREGNIPGEFDVPLAPPIMSNVICDTKDRNLKIYELSDCSCSVAGGKRIILLCGRVNPNNIEVRFFEESNEVVIWESIVEIPSSSVHMRAAISFSCPPYTGNTRSTPVKAYIQLRRRTDGDAGKPENFEFFRGLVVNSELPMINQGLSHILPYSQSVNAGPVVNSELPMNNQGLSHILPYSQSVNAGPVLNSELPMNNQGLPHLLRDVQYSQSGNAGSAVNSELPMNNQGLSHILPYSQSVNAGPVLNSELPMNNQGLPHLLRDVQYSQSGNAGSAVNSELPMNNQGLSHILPYSQSGNAEAVVYGESAMNTQESPQVLLHDQYPQCGNECPFCQGFQQAEESISNKRMRMEAEQTESRLLPIFSQPRYPPVSSHSNTQPVLLESNDSPVSDFSDSDYLYNPSVTTTQIYTHRFCGCDIRIVSDSDQRNEVPDVIMNHLNWETETSSLQRRTSQDILTSSQDSESANNFLQDFALEVPMKLFRNHG